MKCIHALERICDELGENIDNPMCLELQAHLKDCPNCCALVDSMKKTIYLYRQVITETEVPQEVDTRLWKVLNLVRPENNCGHNP